MATYLTTADITDSIKGNFSLDAYLTLADSEIVNMARKFGLTEDQIDTPLDFCIKQWAIAWVLMRLCLDKAGAANVEGIENDKYFVKFNLYRDQCWHYAKKITKEMFLGYVTDIRDMTSTSCQLIRG